MNIKMIATMAESERITFSRLVRPHLLLIAFYPMGGWFRRLAKHGEHKNRKDDEETDKENNKEF